MVGISVQAANSLDNKYEFNGNELQNKEFSDGLGLDAYDFNARTYDPQIGHFSHVDPLGSKFPHQSPYISFDANPINKKDPDGMAARRPTDDWLLRKNGDLVLIKRTNDREHRFFNESGELMQGTLKRGETKARYSWNLNGWQKDQNEIAKALSYSKNIFEYEDMVERGKQLNFSKTNSEREYVEYQHDLGNQIRFEDKAMLIAPNPMAKFKIGLAWKIISHSDAVQGGGIGGRSIRVLNDVIDANSRASKGKPMSFSEMWRTLVSGITNYNKPEAWKR